MQLTTRYHLKTLLMADRFTTKILLARLLFILLMTGCFPIHSFAQPGSLDNTFGTNGKVITTLGSFSDKGNSIAIQGDDKIILVGSTYNSFTTSDFALIRYNSDGNLDTSFGVDGKVITPVESRSEANSVVIQSDGKILLGGSSKYYLNLVRYNSDGTLDTTFGTGGKVITDVNGYYSEKCKSVAIQSDGKILLGGYGQHNNNDNPYFIIVRYNTSGSLDATFGIDGIVIGDVGKGNSIGIQSDGKILLGGSSNLSFAIERYNTNGTLDNTFGLDGKVTTALGINGEGNSMVIQSDGKIVLGGSSSSDNMDFALVRYNSNGTLDIAFGINGKVITPHGSSSKGNAVVIQSNGKIVLGGNASNNANNYNFALVRYNSDGTLDNTFGIDGKIITPIGVSYSIGQSLDIDSNGKIMLGGYVYNGSNADISLVRYNGDASVGIGEVSFKQRDSKIYPNPFNSSTIIDFSTSLHSAELNIYNTHGQLVKQVENISGKEIQLSRSNLPSGIYFLQLTENNKIIVVDKLIISDE